MRRALLLVALASCTKAPEPDAVGDCDRACDHVNTLVRVDTELTIRRNADHSDAETAQHLRDRAASAEDLNHDFCEQHCLEPGFDVACVATAATLEQAQACLRARP